MDRVSRTCSLTGAILESYISTVLPAPGCISAMHHQGSVAAVMHYSAHSVSLSPADCPERVQDSPYRLIYSQKLLETCTVYSETQLCFFLGTQLGPEELLDLWRTPTSLTMACYLKGENNFQNKPKSMETP